MRRDVTAALRLTLRGHLSLRKSRLESFCVLVVGVLLSRTVNLSHLACLFPTRAEIASNYRRLQRFFAQVILDGIPTRADPHALAQSRRPMDMMSQGWSMRRIQATKQRSTMSRQEGTTRPHNPLP